MTKRIRTISRRDQQVRRRIGAAIRVCRIDQGHSIRWLAERVNVDEATMSRIERGKMSISTEILDRVAKAMKADVLAFYAEAA